jgi:hypothetical protein
MCVRRVVKGFICPLSALKDTKISKTKIGWFVFPRHDQAFEVADAKPGGLETATPCSPPGTSVSSVVTRQRFNVE